MLTFVISLKTWVLRVIGLMDFKFSRVLQLVQFAAGDGHQKVDDELGEKKG